MKFISNLKLSKKLGLLVIMPVLIMLLFAIYQSFKSLELLKNSNQLEMMTQFSVKASNLVHELQKERGMTAGFLGSKGEKFAEAIVQQRKSVDDKLNILNQFLTDTSIQDVHEKFNQDLTETLASLQLLEEKRRAVNKFEIQLNDALTYYTGNNNALLGLIELMSKFAPDAEMTIMISAYANYLKGKERAGIERAVLSNVFAKNHMTSNIFNRFMTLITTQDVYTNVFKSLAKEEDIKFYQDTMQGDFIVQTSIMRLIAITANDRTSLINQLVKMVGYGGIIHHFKNYVLRGDEKYIASINENAKSALAIIAQYRGMLGISAQSLTDLNTVEKMIQDYQQATQQVSELKSDGSDVQSIDSVVKINDTPALEAIKRLGKGGFSVEPTDWFKKQTGKINLLKKVEDHLAENLAFKAADLKSIATSELIIAILLSLAGLIISVVLGILVSRNLREQIGGEPSDIQNIADQIADGTLQNKNNNKNENATGIYKAIMTMQCKIAEVIEKEIQGIVDAARHGDLSKRVEIKNKNGFYKSLGEGINELVESSEAIITDTGRVFSSLSQGDLNQNISREYQGSFNQLKIDANTTISKLKEVIEGDIQELVNSTLQGDLSNRIVLIGKQGFFKEMSSGINQLIDSVNNILNDASSAMNSMSQGDLTKPIKNSYVGQFENLKNNINESMSTLETTITSLRDSSFVITSTAREISDGNNSLSSRTESQAAALEQTAARMEELTSTVKNNAENTKLADQLAENAKSTALNGGAVMEQASIAMEEINQSSQKIAEIIGVIDEIAFQTNLLALNASVEAARAGEQGRGFAVVATEVRNLAGRSATAAKEIKELINDSVKKVEIGVSLVEDSTKNQSEIVDSINRVGSIIAEISAASHEQSEGIEQVNTAVTSMDDSTQQNAALAEQTSAAAVSLSDQTGEMSKMMEFFTVSNSTSTRSPTQFSTTAVAVSSTRAVSNQTQPVNTNNKTYTKPVNKPAVKKEEKQTVSFDEDEWEEF